MELQSHHKMIFRAMWAMRHEGLVSHQGGMVYPKDELKKMIKELRRIKEA